MMTLLFQTYFGVTGRKQPQLAAMVWDVVQCLSACDTVETPLSSVVRCNGCKATLSQCPTLHAGQHMLRPKAPTPPPPSSPPTIPIPPPHPPAPPRTPPSPTRPRRYKGLCGRAGSTARDSTDHAAMQIAAKSAGNGSQGVCCCAHWGSRQRCACVPRETSTM